MRPPGPSPQVIRAPLLRRAGAARMPGRGCRQRHAAVLSGRQLGPAQRYRCRQLL